MRRGNQVHNWGNIVIKSSDTPNIKKYGIEPCATSPRLTSPRVTPCKTYKFIPTGGVSNPISPVITNTIANHKGSAPILIMSGNVNGRVISSIEIKSKKQPNIRYNAYTKSITTRGDKPSSCTPRITVRGSPITDTDIEKIEAPTIMKNIIPQTDAAEIRALYSPLKLNARKGKLKIIAAKIPSPAASVGVAIPK